MRIPWERVMGNRLDPRFIGLAPEGEEPSIDVGEYFQVIRPELLVEKGDEYCDDQGCFVPFPLEAVGRPVPVGLVARRPMPSPATR